MTANRINYDRITVTLHWCIAGLIVALLVLGYFLDGLSKGDLRTRLFLVHKSFGLLVLLLALFRFYWKVKRPSPLDLPLPKFLHDASNLAHAALYLLSVAVPLLALWAGSISRGIDFFFLHFNPPFAMNKPLAQSLMSAHGLAAYFLALLLLLHVAAVAWHQVVRKDGIIERMRY